MRLAVLDPSQLGPMAVLEKLDAEAILAARMARLKALWTQSEPPAGIAYDVENLEFDPLKINQEAAADFELLVRDRVNQAARSVTLAFSSGTDLDAIASRYPGGVPRLAGETDARYRRRVWLSPNTLSPHGTAEGYEFWALTALAGVLRDVTVIKVRPELRDNPTIIITCLVEGEDPKPTTAQLIDVRRYIQDESRGGLTDQFTVSAPKVLHTRYRVRLLLYPGQDQGATVATARANLLALRDNLYWLGQDHTHMAIGSACSAAGAQNAIILEPAADLAVAPDWIVKVDDVLVEYAGRAE